MLMFQCLSIRVVDREDCNQNGFFVQSIKRGFAQPVCVTRNEIEVACNCEWSVGVEEVKAVPDHKSAPGEVGPLLTTDRGASAERVSKLLLEFDEKVLILRTGDIRQVHFDSCLF